METLEKLWAERRDMADYHAAQMQRAVRGMDSPPLAHEAMRLTIGRLDNGHGGEVLTIEAEVAHMSEDGLTTTWKPCATEGGVRPCDLGTTLAGLFSRHALALLLAAGLALGGPTLAGDPPKPLDPPAAVEFCRANPNGHGQVPDKACVGGTRHVDCDGKQPGLTYCGIPISG